MGVAITAWRAAIGTFYLRKRSSDKNPFLIPRHLFFGKFNSNYMFTEREWASYLRRDLYKQRTRECLKSIIATSLLLQILLICAGIHPNPGPALCNEYCDISICHANVRSLKTRNNLGMFDKLAEIRCNLADSFDIITLSETWLTDDIQSNDLLLNGFQIPFRNDRDALSGTVGYGGVLSWVSSNIASKRRSDYKLSH